MRVVSSSRSFFTQVTHPIKVVSYVVDAFSRANMVANSGEFNVEYTFVAQQWAA
jgi:hypothetical protein